MTIRAAPPRRPGSRYVDPVGNLRCSASITLGDGSLAQCGRRSRYGGRCWQHGGACRLETEPVLDVEVLAYLMKHHEITTERGVRRAIERSRNCACRNCRPRRALREQRSP